MNKLLSDKKYRIRRKLKRENPDLSKEELKERVNLEMQADQDESTVITSENQNPNLESEIEAGEEIQIDAQGEPGESGFSDLIGRARESLKHTFSEDIPTPRRGRPSGSKASKDDFQTLVVSLVTLIVTFIRIDERIKPNRDEIGAFSDHLAGIILRHSSISGKLSADGVAILGMVMVGAGWYQRVSPVLDELKANKKGPGEAVQYVSVGGEVVPIVLQKVPASTANFLDSAAAHEREE